MYSADGQMQGEAYEYGSFLQSKMFAAGVTCSDCHEPHSQALRAANQEVCGLCHALKKYAAAEHHHHQPGSAQSACTACHMPARTYMVIDRRHDHSFRIPRPDESVSLGTPNACNDCHTDQPPAWAVKALERWHGGVRHGYQGFTEALTAARHQQRSAAADLLALARDGRSPAIARATAIRGLGPYLDSEAVAAAQGSLQSPEALLRLAAVELLAGTDAATRWQMLSPSLTDPTRAVRVAAADAVVDALPADITTAMTEALQRALSEYREAQNLNADRPEAHLNLGNLYLRQGSAAAAEEEYQAAIRRWRGFVPAYVNLADLNRARGRDDQAERWLTEADTVAPDNSAVMLALGLLRVRQHRTGEALQLLARASRLAPGDAHCAYVYGVGLYSMGRTGQGLLVLRKTHDEFPGNRELLLGLASLSAASGDLQAARRYAESFVAMAQADPRGRQMLEQLSPRQP